MIIVPRVFLLGDVWVFFIPSAEEGTAWSEGILATDHISSIPIGWTKDRRSTNHEIDDAEIKRR
jgi:hypothetical protein